MAVHIPLICTIHANFPALEAVEYFTNRLHLSLYA